MTSTQKSIDIAHNLTTGAFIASQVYEKLGKMVKLETEDEFIESYETIRPEIETLARAMNIDF